MGCTGKWDALEILTPTAALLGALDATPLTGFALWHNLVLSKYLIIGFKIAIYLMNIKPLC